MEPRHGKSCDFRLVSTYVPLMFTIVRAQVFVTVAGILRPVLAHHVHVAALLCITYFDALLHAGDHSSVIAGHLLPICFVWLANPASPQAASPQTELLFALNILWVAAVQTLLASYTFRRKLLLSATPVLAVNAVFVLCRLFLPTSPVDVVDLHVRSALFHVFVFTQFYVFQTRPQWDVATHTCLCPHVGMHLFFADASSSGLSLCCTVFMCLRVYLQHKDHHDAEVAVAPDRRTPVGTFVDVEDMADLLAQLLAAKAGVAES
jgi:hypothetical protein